MSHKRIGFLGVKCKADFAFNIIVDRVQDLRVNLPVMQTFKITTFIKGVESDEAFEWKTIPRKGECVELGDAHMQFPYEVKSVVHRFWRPADSKYGEITLELEPRK